MPLSPFDHHHQEILPRLEDLLKHHVFLAAVTTSNPPVPSVVLPLQEETANPKILSDAGLVIKTILLLTHVDPHPRLLENCKCPHRNRVTSWDLKVLSLELLLRTRLDGLRRVHRARDHRRELVERV